MVELFQKALKEIAVAHPNASMFAAMQLHNSVTVVMAGEVLLKRLTSGDTQAAAFVGEGREAVYRKLFTTKGVSENTATELVNEIITLP